MDYMATSTSYRLSDSARTRLARQADREGMTATALLERLITEGIDVLDHSGIVFRGPTNGRRAGLAGGPDVWEVVARLRELDGPEESRIRTLAQESALHPRLIRAALDYAARHRDEVIGRIEARESAISEGQEITQARQALLA